MGWISYLNTGMSIFGSASLWGLQGVFIIDTSFFGIWMNQEKFYFTNVKTDGLIGWCGLTFRKNMIQ